MPKMSKTGVSKVPGGFFVRIKPKKRRKRNASEGVLTPTAVTVEMHRKKDEKKFVFL